MKKTTYLLSLCFCLLTSFAFAQFSESFETEIPDSWTVINQGSTPGWIFNDSPVGGAQDGSGVASISFGSTAHDDYLITPAITVNTGVNDRYSHFVRSRSSFFLESYEVLLSTTDTAVSSFTVVLQAESDAPATWRRART